MIMLSERLFPSKITFIPSFSPPSLEKMQELAKTTPRTGKAKLFLDLASQETRKGIQGEAGHRKSRRSEHAWCVQEFRQHFSYTAFVGTLGIAQGQELVALFSEPTIKPKPKALFPNENAFYRWSYPCDRKALL